MTPVYHMSCFVLFLYVDIFVDMHSICDRYATPFGLTSEYAHPAEILFLGFATIFGPAITGPHLITLWLWMVVRVLETVEAHCGYHFPWSPSNFLPLYGGWVYYALNEIWLFICNIMLSWWQMSLFLWKFQFWLSRLSSPTYLHQVWKLLVNFYLHGLVRLSNTVVRLLPIIFFSGFCRKKHSSVSL